MSQFWGQFSGVVIGSLFTLFGIWLNNFFLGEKRKREKKVEVLETLSALITKFTINYAMSVAVEEEKKFSGAVLNLPENLKVENRQILIDVFREEFPRWVGLMMSTNEKLTEIKSDITKCYFSYKIYFGNDDKLKELVNELMLPIEFELKDYGKFEDVQSLMNQRMENVLKVTSKAKDLLEPKRQRVIDHLDKVVGGLVL